MVLNILAAASQVAASEPLNLSFPLAAGTYYVIQGGNSFVTNPFHSLSGEPLALDIVRLNAFGSRASGIAPRALPDYEIFGDIVRSPCDGTVVAVEDSVADNPPGVSSIEHPANHVTLSCGDAQVYIAHLMQNSAAVATGKAVKRGEPLGRVGNSGYTLEPHLHVGASRGGKAIGLVFNGRWLSMNSVVVTP